MRLPGRLLSMNTESLGDNHEKESAIWTTIHYQRGAATPPTNAHSSKQSKVRDKYVLIAYTLET